MLEEVHISPINNNTPTSPPATSESLKPDNTDRRILELLNARFPVMPSQTVPGAIPRPSLFASPQQEAPDRVTWGELVVASITYGSAAIGFGVIMYDGISTITSFVWGGIMAVVSR